MSSKKNNVRRGGLRHERLGEQVLGLRGDSATILF